MRQGIMNDINLIGPVILYPYDYNNKQIFGYVKNHKSSKH